MDRGSRDGVGRTHCRALASAVLALAVLALIAAPAGASLKIDETVRTEPMSADNDAVVAGCQKGQAPISGGFRTPSFGTSLFVATGSFLGDGGWQASAQRRLGDLGDGSITSFAYCAKLGKRIETRGDSTSFDAGASGSLTASCKRSETLVSGGWAISGSADDQGLVLQSQKTGKRSWTVFGRATAGTITVIALADCVPSNRAPELVTRKSREDSAQNTMFASCNRDEQVVSGGFTSNTVFVPFEFHRASKRKWGISGEAFDFVPGTVTTFAYCEKLAKRR